MMGQRIEWDRAKLLYKRGIITKAELFQCAIEHIQDAKDADDGLLRAFEVDIFMDKLI